MEATKFNYITKQIPKLIIDQKQSNERFDFLIIPSENINFELDINLNSNETKNIQIGIYNHQNFIVDCKVKINYEGEHNNCEVNSIVLGSDKSNTNITIDATVKTENNKVIQNIKGFLLSDNAKISGLPLLNIETNQIIANHGLAIGSLNKEQMFYLMTKGFSKNQVKQILLLSQFENLLSECSEMQKQFYLEQINNLWSKNHD